MCKENTTSYLIHSLRITALWRVNSHCVGCNFTPCCSKRAISLRKILCLHVMINEAGYVLPSNGEISILGTALCFPLSACITCLALIQSLYCRPHKVTNNFCTKKIILWLWTSFALLYIGCLRLWIFSYSQDSAERRRWIIKRHRDSRLSHIDVCWYGVSRCGYWQLSPLFWRRVMPTRTSTTQEGPTID